MKRFSYIDFNPGDEISEETRAWQGCPTIAVTKGGRLFAGWYSGGMFEPCIENYNILIQSDDNGKTWSKPILAIYTDFEKMNRNIDIQLWVDEFNRLWVMWTHSPYYEDSKVATIRTSFDFSYHREFTEVEAMICKNPDADKLVWEEPRIICEGFLRCKPIIRGNGDYIFPAYDYLNENTYMLRVSKDKGETFTNIVAANKQQNKCYDETVVYEIENRIYIVSRTNLGYYAGAYSDDDGKTWSETYNFQNAPSSRLYIGKTSNDLLIMVRNVSDNKRIGMKVCLSEDCGKTWSYELILDTRESVSYPDLTETPNGEFFIIHDRERDNRCKLNIDTWYSDSAKEILVSKITLEDIYNGKIGNNSYVSKVISKAKINFVEK